MYHPGESNPLVPPVAVEGEEHHAPGNSSPASSRGSADTNGSNDFVKLEKPVPFIHGDGSMVSSLDSFEGSGAMIPDSRGSNQPSFAQTANHFDPYLNISPESIAPVLADNPPAYGIMDGSGDSYDFVPKYHTYDSGTALTTSDMEHVDDTKDYNSYVRDESAQDALQDLLGSPVTNVMTNSSNEYVGGFEPSHSPEPMTVSTTNDPDLLEDIAESPAEEQHYANSPRYNQPAVDPAGGGYVTGGGTTYGRGFIEEDEEEEEDCRAEPGTPVRRQTPSPPPGYSLLSSPTAPDYTAPSTELYSSTRSGAGDFSNGSECSFLHISQWNPKVLDVVYWRDPKKSGAILAGLLVVLLLFAYCSVITVLSYEGLLVLFATLSYRLYKSVMGAIQKKDEGNPFRPYLEKEVEIPQAKVHEQVDVCLNHATQLGQHLRRLFLIEDFAESIKFGLVLWALTFIGAWFSGVALLIIGVVAIFTIPKVYELYKEPIDQYYGLAHQKYTEVYNQVKEKVPYLKEKAQ